MDNKVIAGFLDELQLVVAPAFAGRLHAQTNQGTLPWGREVACGAQDSGTRVAPARPERTFAELARNPTVRVEAPDAGGSLASQTAPPPFHLEFPQPATLKITSSLGSLKNTIFSKEIDLASPPRVVVLDQDALTGGVPEAAFETAHLPPGIGVELTAPDATIDRPVEAIVFARDPEAVAKLLHFAVTDRPVPSWAKSNAAPPPISARNILSTPETAESIFGPNEPLWVGQPDAISVTSPGPYTLYEGPAHPSVVNTNWPTTTVYPLRTQRFFRNGIPLWDVPVSRPWDSDASKAGDFGLTRNAPAVGSIKAARLQRPGSCTLNRVLSDFLTDVTAAATESLPCGSVNFDVRSLEIASMIRSDGRQQFWVALDLYANLSSASFLDCEVTAAAIYDLTLDEQGLVQIGIANAEFPNLQGTLAQKSYARGGSFCQDFVPLPPFAYVYGGESIVDQLLVHDLPTSVNARLRDEQSFPPNSPPSKYGTMGAGRRALVGPALFPSFLKCDPTGNDSCFAARQDFCRLARVGFRLKVLGETIDQVDLAIANSPGCILTGSEGPALTALLNTISELDSHGNLAHWRCDGRALGDHVTQAIELPNDGKPLKSGGQSLLVPNATVQAKMDAACGDLVIGLNQSCTNIKAVPIDPSQPLFDANGDFITNPVDGSVTNWQWRGKCAPDFTLGYCVFVPPVRRIIGNPDSVQLVFTEEEPLWADNYADAGLAARYALVALAAFIQELKDAGVTANLPNIGESSMCNYTAPGTTTRPFLLALLDGQISSEVDC